MRYGVIMAGGSGKRLWPMSRQSRPKQLLPLLGGKSLMELAVERLQSVFDDDKIFVITNAEYADQVAEALPSIPRENIIGEPEGRDTANAIALGAEVLAARDEQATMAVFTADHVIRPQEAFAETVEKACQVAEEHPDALLTFGVKPTWPHTGLGYIETGESVDAGVYRVVQFREKPDHQTARRYVESGRHFWNSGMFVWTLGAISAAMKQHLPASQQKLTRVRETLKSGGDIATVLAEVYPKLEKISIDFAVMEKASKVLMVELGCEWLDVGSWPALADVCEKDDADNVVNADTSLLMDSTGNIVVSDDPGHLVAVMGLDDCIIVHCRDATLVCDKADAQRLKELVAEIESHFDGRYV